jgi:hypothetical protein
MKDRQPFTYLIGWSELDTWYYGVRFAKGCSPADIWTTYFTSSTIVAKFRELHGEPDVISIRKTFVDIESAQKWESSAIRRIRRISNREWLNRCAGGVKFYPTGEPLTLEHRLKVSMSLKGRKLTPEHREKIRRFQTGRPITQKRIDGLVAAKKRMTDETKIAMKAKMRDAKLGVKRQPFSVEHKRKIGAANAARASEKRIAKMLITSSVENKVST